VANLCLPPRSLIVWSALRHTTLGLRWGEVVPHGVELSDRDLAGHTPLSSRDAFIKCEYPRRVVAHELDRSIHGGVSTSTQSDELTRVVAVVELFVDPSLETK
jgi:hypothetical protein